MRFTYVLCSLIFVGGCQVSNSSVTEHDEKQESTHVSSIKPKDSSSLIITIDKHAVQRIGISTNQLGQAIQTAIFGGENDTVHLKNLDTTRIVFRNQQGKLIRFPIMSVARFETSDSMWIRSSVEFIEK